MRQVGFGCTTENYKSKFSDKDTPSTNLPRSAVSQSAPHTPVSTPGHSECIPFKTVPRLLSEPAVNSKSRTLSPGTKLLDLQARRSEKNSPYMNDKKVESIDSNMDGVKTVRNSLFVPIHSPKETTKKEKFFLRSPLVKRETKVQIDSLKTDKLAGKDGTDV